MGSLPAILAEGRKFGLQVIMATQFFEQLSKELANSVQGNVGNVLSMRVGPEDAERLVGRFQPEFDGAGLRRMRNFMAAASILVNGIVQPAFSVFVDHIERVDQNLKLRKARRELIVLDSGRYLQDAFGISVADAEDMRRAFREVRTSGVSASNSFLDEWLKRE